MLIFLQRTKRLVGGHGRSGCNNNSLLVVYRVMVIRLGTHGQGWRVRAYQRACDRISKITPLVRTPPGLHIHHAFQFVRRAVDADSFTRCVEDGVLVTPLKLAATTVPLPFHTRVFINVPNLYRKFKIFTCAKTLRQAQVHPPVPAIKHIRYIGTVRLIQRRNDIQPVLHAPGATLLTVNGRTVKNGITKVA